jgi:hypothetical protein
MRPFRDASGVTVAQFEDMRQNESGIKRFDEIEFP